MASNNFFFFLGGLLQSNNLCWIWKEDMWPLLIMFNQIHQHLCPFRQQFRKCDMTTNIESACHAIWLDNTIKKGTWEIIIIINCFSFRAKKKKKKEGGPKSKFLHQCLLIQFRPFYSNGGKGKKNFTEEKVKNHPSS